MSEREAVSESSEPDPAGPAQEPVRNFFRLHMRLFGDDWRALGWHSRQTQYRRFAVLCEVGDLAQCRILDVGCGLGDLYGYLKAERIDVDYTGCDLLPEMVDRAQRRYPEARFIVQDVLQAGLGDESFDYILSSGAFNIDFGDNVAAVQRAMQVMVEQCKLGVAINFLSISDSGRDPIFYHYDPQVMLAYARTLSSQARLQEGYLPNDFTLYLYP